MFTDNQFTALCNLYDDPTDLVDVLEDVLKGRLTVLDVLAILHEHQDGPEGEEQGPALA